jgi:hypothetical protein
MTCEATLAGSHAMLRPLPACCTLKLKQRARSRWLAPSIVMYCFMSVASGTSSVESPAPTPVEWAFSSADHSNHSLMQQCPRQILPQSKLYASVFGERGSDAIRHVRASAQAAAQSRGRVAQLPVCPTSEPSCMQHLCTSCIRYMTSSARPMQTGSSQCNCACNHSHSMPSS